VSRSIDAEAYRRRGPAGLLERANADPRQLLELAGVRGDDGAVRRTGGRRDDQIVGSSRSTGSGGRREQARVHGGRRERVVLDRDARQDVADVGGSGLAPATGRQLDADEQFGGRDRGDGDVVLVRDQATEDLGIPLGRDEDGRVEDQPFQRRRSDRTEDRTVSRSFAQPGSGR
jgi:hypothetical protein